MESQKLRRHFGISNFISNLRRINFILIVDPNSWVTIVRARSSDDLATLRCVEFERIVDCLAHNDQPGMLCHGFENRSRKTSAWNFWEPITGAGFPSYRRRYARFRLSTKCRRANGRIIQTHFLKLANWGWFDTATTWPVSGCQIAKSNSNFICPFSNILGKSIKAKESIWDGIIRWDYDRGHNGRMSGCDW